MMNEVRTVGNVVNKLADGDALVIVVQVANGQYTDEVACRFWGPDKVAQANQAQVGNVVAVWSSARSKPGKQGGKYFTDLSSFKLVVLA